MAKKLKNQSAKTPIDIFADSRISIFLQSGLITITMIAVIGGGMYLLDKKLGTFPVLFIIGLVMAFPLTQIYLFKRFRHYAKDKLATLPKKKNG